MRRKPGSDLLAEIRQSQREVVDGHYVRNDEVRAWLLSWGTENELPLPKCVCGKLHEGE